MEARGYSRCLTDLHGVASSTARHVHVSVHGVSPCSRRISKSKRSPTALLISKRKWSPTALLRLQARRGDVEVQELVIVRHVEVSTYLYG